jgi:hypothetical protein
MVVISFPSSRLVTKTNVLRFGPAGLPLANQLTPSLSRFNVLLLNAVVRLKRFHRLLVK